MTTTIQSGTLNYSSAIGIGSKVRLMDTDIEGRVTYMSFGRHGLRVCVQYTDTQNCIRDQWEDVEDMTEVS